MAKDKHLTIEDLAEREGVEITTVLSWNVHGTGPDYIRLPRGIRYRIGDVLEWEESRVVAGSRRPGAGECLNVPAA